MPKLKTRKELFELPKDKLFAHIRKANYESLRIHFEAIYRKGFELTTTIQAESFNLSRYEEKYVQIAKKLEHVLLRFDNSEEGGRFDRCISQYKIVWIGEVNYCIFKGL